MPIPQDQYENLLKNGGSITFTVPASELKFTRDVEASPSIAPLLHSGFEIRPSIVVYEDKAAGQIYAGGDEWTRAIAFIYRQNGSIVYKKKQNGEYEVTMSCPVSKT